MKPLLLLWLAGVSLVAFAEPIEDFAFTVSIEGAGMEPFYRLAVPQAVYEGAAHADLRDLRVFNGHGEVVPHAFRSAGPKPQQQGAVPLALFPLHGPRDAKAEDMDVDVVRAGDKVNVRVQVRGGAAAREALLGYLIDASTLDTPLSGLRFRWGDGGAQRLTSVRIESSNDLRQWTTLISNAPLGGLSHAGRRLERDTVELRRVRAGYLRLTWQDGGREIALAGVEAMLPEQWAQADRVWKEVATTTDAAAPGDYAFDAGGRFPVDRLEFRLPQENTVVPVQVFSRNDPKDKWTLVASTVAYRIRQGDRELSSAPLALGPDFHRYWLLRVNMKAGGIGSGPLGVRLGWSPRELVFNARGGGPFRLAFGNPRAEPSALAMDTLVPGLRTDQEPQIPMVVGGTQEKLAGKAGAAPPIDRKKWGLWAALAAAVAVLAWMAWQVYRQMNKADANP